MHPHALVPGLDEARSRSSGERGDPLDRVDLGGELGEDSGLIARAGADVENAFAARQREGLGDPRDHVGLRDRLPLADRQSRVLVRAGPQL